MKAIIYLFSFAALILAISSCSTDASAQDNLTESEDYCFNWYNGTKQNFTTAFEVDNANTKSFDLVFTISPGEGAYFASPFSMNNWLGLLELSLNESKYIRSNGKFTESPQSVEEFDEISKDYVNWVKTTTTYTYHIDLLSTEDFREEGNFAFVIEPECNRYRVDFEINQKDGEIKVVEKTIVIDNLSD